MLGLRLGLSQVRARTRVSTKVMLGLWSRLDFRVRVGVSVTVRVKG